jgi:hypothetical protein
VSLTLTEILKHEKRTSLFCVIATLSFLSLVAIPTASAATLPLQSGLAWNFVQGTNAGNSYFNMQVAVWGKDPPSHVALNMGLYYIPSGLNQNWTVVWNHGASFNYNAGATNQSVSFTIPFKGAGEYLFVANFQNNAGQPVAQSIVDPKIEPEFR